MPLAPSKQPPLRRSANCRATSRFVPFSHLDTSSTTLQASSMELGVRVWLRDVETLDDVGELTGARARRAG